MPYLFKGVTTNQSSTAVTSDGARNQIFIWAGADGTGDMGGGKVTIQTRCDADPTPWITPTLPDGTPAEFTANTTRIIDFIAQGCQLRVTLSGASSPDPVYVFVS